MNSPIRLAINGYGRIGRCFLRALHESPLRHKYQIVAINEPSDLDSMAYLSRFDSTHGVFPGTVERDGESLIINGDAISVSHADTPDGVDWGRLGIDMLVDGPGASGLAPTCRPSLVPGAPADLFSPPPAAPAVLTSPVCNASIPNRSGEHPAEIQVLIAQP